MILASMWFDYPGKVVNPAFRDQFNIMVASARQVMPDIEIWQLSDMDTKILDADKIVRRPFNEDFVPWCAEHYATLPEGTIFIDSDILVVKDLSPLLTEKCDLLLTHRVGGNLVWKGRHMRHNLGVFVKWSSSVWLEIANRVRAMPHPVERNWYGSQIAAYHLQEEAFWNIKSVPMIDYNYIPKDAKDCPDYARCVHYKGVSRQGWMLEKWSELNNEKRRAA